MNAPLTLEQKKAMQAAEDQAAKKAAMIQQDKDRAKEILLRVRIALSRSVIVNSR